ncbi:hypothetical protein P43SY_005744 [Pythium insidiosum]|uniref:TKL protein kinase n=1 Tax=Pythium insidiosum TaxID=114742 RepID=A0AAD5LTB4_PYTIN|nr:hypothetical protein P43SY_005744 [Pythium insidiosum]KAJ0412521.1 hypothetical protein ATCC90586_006888 [Pythium insidiosum]
MNKLAMSGASQILTIDELRSQNEWIPVSKRDNCVMCGGKFGTFRRKHHCRVCGDIMCSTCTLKRRALLPFIGMCKVKVCVRCASGTRTSDEQHTVVGSDDEMETRAGPMDSVSMSDDDLNNLEALFSPTTVPETEKNPYAMWSTTDLNVPWVDTNDLEDVRLIANGSFRSVWLVRYCQARPLAAKRVLKERLDKRTANCFVQDIQLVSKLQHPRIIEFIGVSWTKERHLQALFEYAPGGDLRSYLDATPSGRDRQRDLQKVQIALDIAEALVYVHSLSPPLVHYGLSSRSVLLMEDMRVKLSDVGVSRSPFEDNATMLGLGSGWWLAPEVITGRTSYSSACDIYEFGVILSELETHQMPFRDYRGPHGNVLSPATVLCMISVGQLRLNFSSLCPLELTQLANECLSLDPRDRPSAVEIAVRLRSFLRTIGAEYEVQTPQSYPQGQGIVLCEGIDA